MKKTTILFILALSVVSIGFGQKKSHDEIKALKTAFITQQLELTSSEAEKFWPVYNSYDSEIHKLRKEYRDHVKTAFEGDMDTVSQQDAAEILQHIKQHREKENRLETQLESDLVKQLGAKRVLKLKKAEYDFKMQLLKKYRGRKK
ncbi:hypothetical protein [Planktosalinus lacus]|uniref:Sensor of ECF-type sigma factor n=1 Tax=Planktosalinus lacus TaxID=1526573 RepID=A0A8J2V8K7_9FLAO|nr:hypothetical protein [Planktosalinus lacus]GGD85553.1 hypothetical protein GCM10011312_07000 [Planktosalinus lacus]